MTIHELVRLYKEKNPDGHFFDEEHLEFFGEKLSRMRVLERYAVVADSLGEDHTCYVVAVTRNKDWNGRCKSYGHCHFFDIETLLDV